MVWSDLISVSDEPVTEEWGLEEDFDSGLFPPENWSLDCPGHPWEQAYDLQEETNGVAQFPNYWVSTDGAFDQLITPGFNPIPVDVITFDYAHRKYGDYVDGLEVWGRLNIEDEWTVFWSAYGDDLSVEDCYTWFWYDTDGEVAWETVTIVPPNYWYGTEGATCAELAFVNVGGYGNHIWIDNVRVGTPGSVDELSNKVVLNVYPNPSNGVFNFSLSSDIRQEYIITDAMGRVVEKRLSSKRFNVDLSGEPSGIYLLSIPGVVSSRLVVK